VADKAWNIARKMKNNSPSYNHTIEQMVRGANIESGGFINYEVELFINWKIIKSTHKP
jgi:hypothetical protein